MNKHQQKKLEDARQKYDRAVSSVRKALHYPGRISLFSPAIPMSSNTSELSAAVWRDLSLEGAYKLRELLNQSYDKQAVGCTGGKRIKCWPTELAGRIVDELSKFIVCSERLEKCQDSIRRRLESRKASQGPKPRSEEAVAFEEKAE